jgi:organic radical activating enzyme
MNSKVIMCGDPNYNIVQFEWFLTNWCNFKCSYCSEADNMIDRYSKETSPGKYKLVLSRLKNIKDPFKVELIGGEPTLHPAIHEILSTLNSIKSCQRVEVVTNLSRTLEFYKDIDYDNVYLLASYHPEYYTPEFVKKAAALGDKVIITLNLSDNPAVWDDTIGVINTLEDLDVRYSFNMLNSTAAYQVNYTDEFFEKFNSYLDHAVDNEQISYLFSDGSTQILNESEILKNKLDHFCGYQCTPIRYRISHNGDIHNLCTNKRLPIMITTESLYAKEICPNTACGCDAMYIFYKEQA